MRDVVDRRDVGVRRSLTPTYACFLQATIVGENNFEVFGVLDKERFEIALNICRKNSWISRERFKEGLETLLGECVSGDHIWLIEKMIDDFNVVSSRDLDDAVREIFGVITSEWKLAPNEAAVFAVADGNDPDGSQVFVKSLENALGRKWKNSVFSRIDASFNFKKKKIILVDDFVGTGDKAFGIIFDLIALSQVSQVEVEIFFVALAGMNEGLERIAGLIGGDFIFSKYKFSKAISGIGNACEHQRALNAMLDLEIGLVSPAPYPEPKNYRCYSFGYGGSEALFWLEGFNIPNNVFPIFWKDSRFDPNQLLPRKGKGKKVKNVERKTIFTRS